jgi:anti-anti-sigma factor
MKPCGEVAVDIDVEIRELAGNVIVVVAGDIDADAANGLRQALIQVIMRRRPERLVVDLSRVTDLDAVSIGALQAAQAAADVMNLTMLFHTAGSPEADRLSGYGVVDSGCHEIVSTR